MYYYMALENLKSYEKWVGKSPFHIKKAVKLLSPFGWSMVFSRNEELPQWVNRIRNYFNETPKKLYRLGVLDALKAESKLSMPGAKAMFGLYGGTNNRARFILKKAFNIPDFSTRIFPFVFKDSAGKLWYMMTPGAGIFHVGNGQPSKKAMYLAQVWETHDTQGMPFKLVCPDNLGGSSEIIIKNPRRLKAEHAFPKANQWYDIKTNLDWNPVTRGTYNYAETFVEGFDSHEHYDVKPHKIMTKSYVNPEKFTALWGRLFTENLI